MAVTDSPYGFCPKCGAKGATRERRPNGFDTCVNAHAYSSRAALSSSDSFPRIMSGLNEVLALSQQTPTETQVVDPLMMPLSINYRDV